ncbi:FecR family protein (plasmid) [Ensifer sp. PDNC004]|uniref:FecR family protein n=1 Tax=Ensifer sp. PDNC004 TaxID=2811423 RepID=UPI00196602A4|nr:FecR family protein [Ensifer sp. PDNC004]QRY64931.1 FecR family protein [Ensifer sp. PDNC004]
MTKDNHISEALLEEAMDWFLELKARPNCRETEAGFRAWLGQSDLHAQAWETALRTWQLLGEVPPVNEHLWRGARPSVAVETTIRQRRRMGTSGLAAGVALALAACLALFVSVPSLFVWWQADHVTETAQNRTVTLVDGTIIEMGGGSAIATDIGAGTRHVRLLKGEAFFNVARDPSRPFVVEAGGVEVSVLGTAFDVQLASTETTVELAHGTVAVSYSANAHRQNFELAPGEMATVSHATGAVVRSAIAEDEIGAWRSGRMFVNDVTVAAAAERLQRYHSAWISIPQPDLAARRVTGVYDLKDPDRALQALVQPFGGKVREVTRYGRILTRF